VPLCHPLVTNHVTHYTSSERGTDVKNELASDDATPHTDQDARATGSHTIRHN
jgi:hypothetical protein